MAIVQSEKGNIHLFEDFSSGVPLAGTVLAPYPFGDFMVIGDGLDASDAGIPALTSDGLGGVGQFTTKAEDAHCTGLATGTMFDVAKMGTLVAEVRVRNVAVPSTTKVEWIGFSDYTSITTAVIESTIISGSGTTITLVASDLCGFFCGDLTAHDQWHCVYNGGATTGATTSTDVDYDTIVAGDFQILRVEIDPDGTARWYIDGVLKQTVEGAVSTTTDLGFQCMLETEGSTAETMDVDYISVKANRDWTV
jgi:hypothetical protein